MRDYGVERIFCFVIIGIGGKIVYSLFVRKKLWCKVDVIIVSFMEVEELNNISVYLFLRYKLYSLR